jgi:hypothetical protein
MNNNYGNDYGASGTSAGSTASKTSESKSDKTESRSTESRSHETHGVDLRKYADEAKSLGRSLESQMTTRPYVVLGAVAGGAFVAGSLLGSRIGQLAIAIGVGYAATRLLQDPELKSEVRDIARKATHS